MLADLAEAAALEPERARLEALRLTALEDRVEADLALVGELKQLMAEHPYREWLWGQLMLALYRSGRQADALQAFHRARPILDEDCASSPPAGCASRGGKVRIAERVWTGINDRVALRRGLWQWPLPRRGRRPVL
jgi:DNA-binding SARP family transcriptional activator